MPRPERRRQQRHDVRDPTIAMTNQMKDLVDRGIVHTMECAHCQGTVSYMRAPENGHIRAKCDGCMWGWRQ